MERPSSPRAPDCPGQLTLNLLVTMLGRAYQIHSLSVVTGHELCAEGPLCALADLGPLISTLPCRWEEGDLQVYTRGDP